MTATTTFTQMRGGTTFTAAVGGLTTLQGGTGVAAEIMNIGPNAFVINSGSMNISGGAGAGGYARLLGNPDVHVTINAGMINLNSGAGGAYAAIESVAPSSVYVNFPNLTRNGYSVNGVANAVYDPATATGFIAGGVPAILATNLLVTYGGAAVSAFAAPPPPPVVQQQINQVVQQTTQIVTRAQQLLVANSPDDGPDAQVEPTSSVDGSKQGAQSRKSLPVCR